MIATVIGKQCPKLRTLRCTPQFIGSNDWLIYGIMKALPPQQITNLEDNGFYADLSHPTAISAIQRHSTTLRKIVLGRVEGLSRVSFAIIVDNCINLNSLSIDTYILGQYIDLTQTQGLPWCCTKLHSLTLGITGCELPPVDAARLPYYDRPTPIVLSQAEAEHFTLLERLYMQIGRLTELRQLDITMIELNEEGEVAGNWRDISTSFPAMLSLGNTLEGRPGFLRHFSGLTKLERLSGSVRADTEETRTTMDWKEATWMDEHWPKLEHARFFGLKKDIRASFLWLQDQRKHGRDQLKLTVKSNE